MFDGYADPTRAPDVEAAQQRVVALRNLSNKFPQIPTVKAMLADRYGNPGWSRVLPPLMPLTAEEQATVRGLRAAA